MLRLFILVAALTTVINLNAGEDVSRCPGNLPQHYMRTFRDRCYLLVTYRQDYWEDAKLQCFRSGGRLARVPDNDTQNFLAASLQQLGYSGRGVWIGLTDYDTEGEWLYENGEKATFTNWSPGQPGIFGAVEDCVMMEREQGYKWGDFPCHLFGYIYSYICEFQMAPTTTPTTTTPTTTTPTTTTPTTTTPTTTTPTTTTPTTTTPSTEATSPTTTTPLPTPCPFFTCSKDCGLAAFKVDSHGCPICECSDH